MMVSEGYEKSRRGFLLGEQEIYGASSINEAGSE
jgi:hypothetical protein